MDEEDCEYEYEYDPNEMSTFLVELDLATLNGIQRGSVQRGAGRSKKRYRTKRTEAAEAAEALAEDGQDDGASDTCLDGDTQPRRKQASSSSLQVLDLNTSTPFVAHKGDFYSCAWHDVIGTDMFFAPPHQKMSDQPMRSNADYQLLGTSRIRLVGSKARVVEREQARKKQRGDSDLLGESGLGAAQEQNIFLQKLAEIREARQIANQGLEAA